MFLLISCSLVVAFQYFLCFVHGEGQQASKKREQKYITKRLASFIASLVLSTRAKVGGRFRPFILRCSRTCLCTQLGRGEGIFTLFFKRNFIFFVCQVMKNLEWPSEKESILYKIFLNKEITDWQKYGRKTLGEEGGDGIHLKWPYGQVLPFGVWFSDQFGVKWGIHFALLAWKGVRLLKP